MRSSLRKLEKDRFIEHKKEKTYKEYAMDDGPMNDYQSNKKLQFICIGKFRLY